MCFNTVCDRWKWSAWLGLEVDDSDSEVFIHRSQRKDGEATRQVKGMAGGAKLKDYS
jgi:hypothetical protein